MIRVAPRSPEPDTCAGDQAERRANDRSVALGYIERHGPSHVMRGSTAVGDLGAVAICARSSSWRPILGIDDGVDGPLVSSRILPLPRMCDTAVTRQRLDQAEEVLGAAVPWSGFALAAWLQPPVSKPN